MEQSPVGSQRTCRFAFTHSELTAEQERAFRKGGGLPEGAAFDPPVVKLRYEPPETSSSTTLEGEAITHEAEGIYHAIVPVSRKGVFRWRGVGIDLSGAEIVATRDMTFEGIRTF